MREKGIWSDGGWWRAPNAIYDHWCTFGFNDGHGVWHPLTIKDQAIYLCLHRHADANMQCFPSFATLARETGTSPRSAMRSIVHLEKARLIQKTRRRGAGKRYTSNLYTILPLPVSFVSIDSVTVADGDSDRVTPGSVTVAQEEDSLKKTHKQEESSFSLSKEEKSSKDALLSEYGLAKKAKAKIVAVRSLEWIQAAATIDVPPGAKIAGVIWNRHKEDWQPPEPEETWSERGERIKRERDKAEYELWRKAVRGEITGDIKTEGKGESRVEVYPNEVNPKELREYLAAVLEWCGKEVGDITKGDVREYETERFGRPGSEDWYSYKGLGRWLVPRYSQQEGCLQALLEDLDVRAAHDGQRDGKGEARNG